MLRWLVLAVFSIAPLTIGCGSSVRAGLANAPRLGGTATADDRVADVVSNGDDACGLSSESGVMRNRIPPCPRPTSVHNVAVSVGRPSSGEPNGGLVEPWLNHFYVGWPCATKMPASDSSEARTSPWSPWSPSRPVATACSAR